MGSIVERCGETTSTNITTNSSASRYVTTWSCVTSIRLMPAPWTAVCIRGGNSDRMTAPPSHLSVHRISPSLEHEALNDMKVYQLTLLSVSSGNPAKAAVLGSAQDLSSFSMFQRGSIAQFMSFFAQV